MQSRSTYGCTSGLWLSEWIFGFELYSFEKQGCESIPLCLTHYKCRRGECNWSLWRGTGRFLIIACKYALVRYHFLSRFRLRLCVRTQLSVQHIFNCDLKKLSLGVSLLLLNQTLILCILLWMLGLCENKYCDFMLVDEYVLFFLMYISIIRCSCL